MHDASSFVTLTYDDKNYEPSLNYKDFQRFMYRLRERFGPTRFFACGEYGETTLRPHFHCLLFGRTFANPEPVGEHIYSSPELNKLWPAGFSSFGSVTYESAAYVAGYACKKISGPRADSHYTRLDLRTGELCRVVPEFGRMSLKPGLGYTWFQKYWKEVYLGRDGVMQRGGKTTPPPRYYDKLLEETDVDLRQWLDFDRYVRSGRFADDCTPDRLAVREKCALAKRQFVNRSSL